MRKHRKTLMISVTITISSEITRNEPYSVFIQNTVSNVQWFWFGSLQHTPTWILLISVSSYGWYPTLMTFKSRNLKCIDKENIILPYSTRQVYGLPGTTIATSILGYETYVVLYDRSVTYGNETLLTPFVVYKALHYGNKRWYKTIRA